MSKITKTHQKRAEASKSRQGQIVHAAPRQTRQVSSVASDKGAKLPLGKMKTLKMMILDVKERRQVGYRWFERFHKHCFGWYQQIGSGNFKQVHATEQDYCDVKQVYDLLRDNAKLDSELLTLLLDYLEQRSKCDETMNRIVTIARRNTK